MNPVARVKSSLLKSSSVWSAIWDTSEVVERYGSEPKTQKNFLSSGVAAYASGCVADSAADSCFHLVQRDEEGLVTPTASAKLINCSSEIPNRMLSFLRTSS